MVSCAKKVPDESEKDTLQSAYKTITVTKDIPYRHGDSDPWKPYLAMPANFGPEIRPALIIIHGGGWAAGSKSVDVYQKMIVDYAQKGYVTINVEYRLTGEAPFPACIEDVKCAVRWLYFSGSASIIPYIGYRRPHCTSKRTRDFVEKMKATGANIMYPECEGGHGVAYAEKLEITEPAPEEFFAKYLK